MTESATPRPGIEEQGPFVNLDAVALPGAGAFGSPTYTPIPPKSRRLSLIVTYAKGAGATSGSVVLRLQWQLTAGSGPLDDVYETLIDGSTLTKSTSFASAPEYAFAVVGPPTTTSISFRALSVEVPILAVAARVLAAEIGDTANPGTVTARLYTSDEV